MSLIIKDKIKKFIPGYPTVSDKYNVSGAVLTGTQPVEFGDLVGFSGTKGYFEKLTTAASAADVAGIVLATNVKLNLQWPEGNVQTLPGEAFNLLVNGFMAVKLDANAVEANVKPNAQVYVTPTATLTTEAAGNFALTGVVFTGEVETQGTTLVAEIYVK